MNGKNGTAIWITIFYLTHNLQLHLDVSQSAALSESIELYRETCGYGEYAWQN